MWRLTQNTTFFQTPLSFSEIWPNFWNFGINLGGEWCYHYKLPMQNWMHGPRRHFQSREKTFAFTKRLVDRRKTFELSRRLKPPQILTSLVTWRPEWMSVRVSPRNSPSSQLRSWNMIFYHLLIENIENWSLEKQNLCFSSLPFETPVYTWVILQSHPMQLAKKVRICVEWILIL